MEAIWSGIQDALGLDVKDLNALHMALRAIITYPMSILMVRIGKKRFSGQSTAFDIILGIILGSVISRAITGSSPFFPTLVAGFALVMIHWGIAILSFHWQGFGTLVKGSSRTLVKDGVILWDAMRASHISFDDLLQGLRSEGRIDKVEQTREARLERSGTISVIRASREPKVLEIQVREGVQTIRLQIE